MKTYKNDWVGFFMISMVLIRGVVFERLLRGRMHDAVSLKRGV